MANIKYFVVDERKCGKGDNYNSDKKIFIEQFDTKSEAKKYIRRLKMANLIIEKWDMESGIYLDSIKE